MNLLFELIFIPGLLFKSGIEPNDSLWNDLLSFFLAGKEKEYT